MTGNFKDLQFRGTLWYLASEVDQKLMELKEKAEKWERLSRHLSHGPGWVIDSITTDGWGEIFGAWEKLEAIKKWCKHELFKSSLHSKGYNRKLRELWKILEAEG